MAKMPPFDDPRMLGLDSSLMKAVEYGSIFAKHLDLVKSLDRFGPMRLDPSIFGGAKALAALAEVANSAALFQARQSEAIVGIARLNEASQAAMGLLAAGPTNAFLEMQGALSQALQLTQVTNGILKRLDVAELGTAFNLSYRHQELLASGLSRVDQSFEHLYKSVQTPDALASLPRILVDLPPQELFVHARVLEAISVPPAHDAAESIEERTANPVGELPEGDLNHYLSELGAGLEDMWGGAEAALDSRNPDRVRHALVSLRELLTRVLHALSPDAAIKSWSTSDSDFVRGRPTRRTRLLFVARHADSGPLSRFLRADVASATELFEVLNRGVHEADTGLSDDQARLVRSRAGHILLFLFELARIAGRPSGAPAGETEPKKTVTEA
jgi:Predicted pPIWI-associating nuclease